MEAIEAVVGIEALPEEAIDLRHREDGNSRQSEMIATTDDAIGIETMTIDDDQEVQSTVNETVKETEMTDEMIATEGTSVTNVTNEPTATTAKVCPSPTFTYKTMALIPSQHRTRPRQLMTSSTLPSKEVNSDRRTPFMYQRSSFGLHHGKRTE